MSRETAVTEVELRPLADADVPAAVELYNRVSQAAYGVDDMSEHELRLFLQSPSVDPERDVRVAVASDGALIGYADVFDQNALHTRYWFELRVDPRASVRRDRPGAPALG